MSEILESPLRIGEWRLDPLTSTLSRGEETVSLDQRSLQLLLCLSRQPGAVVTADKLLDEVWPDVTVGQDSVYQAIAGLRRSLGDSPRQPAYIATVPRKGYRLIAPVSHGTELAAIKPVQAPDLRSAPKSGTITVLAGIVFLMVVAVFLRYGPAFLWTKAEPSIAVLAFQDMTSQSMSEEYLADSVTEELIGRLAAVPGFHVASPTASFGLKGKDLQPADIAKQLGVIYIVDGSLREAEGKRRIAVRLVRGKDGMVLWGGSYDSTDQNVLELQDNIAADVAAALKKRLSPAKAGS